MKELVNKIKDGETTAANDLLNNAMLDKIRSAVATKKVEVASNIFNKTEENENN